MVPYQHEGRLFADVQQIIPLPEAEEYQVRVRSKEQAVRQQRTDLANLTGTKALQLRFWTFFSDFARTHSTIVKPTKPLAQNWMTFSMGRGGYRLVAVASTWDTEAESYESHELRVEFDIAKDPNGVVFEGFLRKKEAIESDLGYKLFWENAPEKISRKVWVKRSVNLNDESDWGNQARWLIGRLEEFTRVFGPLVRNL
jgi:hypothetical protein